jgi:N-acetylglucosaminyldiphosphoundecaprenol N-acetyl-beta-D-mannosaminyltransferase
VGFLGSGPSVAELTAECLKKEYPTLRVGMVSQEWKDELKKVEVDILFVAFGSPKQEIWMSENLKNVSAKVLIGVGGSFDFISGKVRRAPKILRLIGLEWLFRLMIQPWRIKRQLRLLKFIALVLKEKFSFKEHLSSLY